MRRKAARNEGRVASAAFSSSDAAALAAVHTCGVPTVRQAGQ